MIEKKICAGDSLAFFLPRPSDVDGDEATLVLRGLSKIEIEGDWQEARIGWDFSMSPAESAALAVGKYRAMLVCGDGVTSRSTRQVGNVEVWPDPVTAETFDNRTFAQKMVEDIEKALSGFAGAGGRVKSYQIGSKTITYRDVSELLNQLNYWKQQVAAENGGNFRRWLVGF